MRKMMIQIEATDEQYHELSVCTLHGTPFTGTLNVNFISHYTDESIRDLGVANVERELKAVIENYLSAR